MITYPEAVKKVAAHKQRENYMVIKLTYEVHIVLPFKEGTAFINSLMNAEMLKESYNEKKRISEFARDTIVTTLMSSAEYDRFKIAALLDITPDEVKEYELAAN